MTSPLSVPTQSIDEIDRLIRAAISDKVPLRAVYDGGVRILCPQMLGRNKDGRVRILCLQVGGESSTGLERKVGEGDWRCLSLEKFIAIERADDAAWQTAGSSLRRPKCIDRVELEVTDQPDREPQKGQ